MTKTFRKELKVSQILLVILKNIYKSKICRWPHGHITGKLVLTDLRVYDTTVTAPYYLYIQSKSWLLLKLVALTEEKLLICKYPHYFFKKISMFHFQQMIYKLLEINYISMLHY